MAKSVVQRVLDSFPGPESTIEAKEYAKNVYSTWKDISASLSRISILTLLLAIGFELIVYEPKGTVISIGTLTLGNAPIIQIALPAVVAFLFYDSCRLTFRWLDLQRAYMVLTRILAPVQRDNALDLLIAPNLPSLWTIGPFYARRRVDWRMIIIAWCITFIVVFITPIAFEFQAYYRLVEKFGYDNPFLWVSAVVTTIIGFYTGMYALFNIYTGDSAPLQRQDSPSNSGLGWPDSAGTDT